MGPLLSGTLPAILLMAFVARYDSKRPEPKKQLYLATLFGGLSTIPVIFVQLGLEKANPGGVTGALYTAFFVAALTEECAKALALYFAVWRHPAFDERLDGIVCATRAGLGFALVENVGYLMGAESMEGFLGIIEVSDNGTGIPELVLARLFHQAGRRGDRAGLSVCGTIVTGLGGTIDVRSREGAGTTFT